MKDRAERLKEVTKNVKNIESHLPLLVENKISESALTKLRGSVTYYIWTSLINAFPDKNFIFSNNLMWDYSELIGCLPNRTPNGLVLPKRENFLSYHGIHQAVVGLLETFKDEIELIHNPINIRLVKGNSDGKDRPKASTKLHSDIWAGEFASSLMVFLPVFGDIENIGVEFFEPPLEFYPEYVRPLRDYDEGAHFLEKSTKYDCKLKNGFMYIMDPFLLHRTFKNSQEWRLSLDFRFIPKMKLESDLEVGSKRSENYITYDEWKEIGLTKLLFTDTPIDQYDKKRESNIYAADYLMVNLK